MDLLYLQRSTGGAGKGEEARSDEESQSSGHTGSGANTGSVSGGLSNHTQSFLFILFIFNAVKYFISILVDKKRIILIFETKFSICINVMDGMFASWNFYINILYLFLFFAQHKHKQFRELLEHYRFNLLYMFNLSYFTEAILKNRTLTDAKKREQFTILKKQMEMDLMVKSMHVIYTNHFCHAWN